jgi:hypothetical protein
MQRKKSGSVAIEVKRPAATMAKCPVCHRSHWMHEELGIFCSASCLQMMMRPLIVAMREEGGKR